MANDNTYNNCHEQCCMESMQSSHRQKSQVTMDTTPLHIKKFAGDGVWDTKKEILGWDIDRVEYTIQLPAKKCVDICDS